MIRAAGRSTIPEDDEEVSNHNWVSHVIWGLGLYSGCAAYVSMLFLVGCHGSMRMRRKKVHSRAATPTTITTTTMGPAPAPTKG